MKCWFFHNWSNYAEPFQVYGGHWKQTRICKDCGKITTIDIGFIQASNLNIPKETK